MVFVVPAGAPGPTGPAGPPGPGIVLTETMFIPYLGTVQGTNGADTPFGWTGPSIDGSGTYAGAGMVAPGLHTSLPVSDTFYSAAATFYPTQVSKDGAAGASSMTLVLGILPANWSAWGANGIRLRFQLSSFGGGGGPTTARLTFGIRNPTALNSTAFTVQADRVQPAVDATFQTLQITKANLDTLTWEAGKSVLMFDMIMSNPVASTGNPNWRFGVLALDWS